MEWISDRIWTVVAAIVSALGGYVIYEKKLTDVRFKKLEEAVIISKIEIAVIQSQFKDLKEDTQEIKNMLNILVRK